MPRRGWGDRLFGTRANRNPLLVFVRTWEKLEWVFAYIVFTVIPLGFALYSFGLVFPAFGTELNIYWNSLFFWLERGGSEIVFRLAVGGVLFYVVLVVGGWLLRWSLNIAYRIYRRKYTSDKG